MAASARPSTDRLEPPALLLELDRIQSNALRVPRSVRVRVRVRVRPCSHKFLSELKGRLDSGVPVTPLVLVLFFQIIIISAATAASAVIIVFAVLVVSESTPKMNTLTLRAEQNSPHRLRTRRRRAAAAAQSSFCGRVGGAKGVGTTARASVSLVQPKIPLRGRARLYLLFYLTRRTNTNRYS